MPTRTQPKIVVAPFEERQKNAVDQIQKILKKQKVDIRCFPKKVELTPGIWADDVRQIVIIDAHNLNPQKDAK